MVTRGRVQNGVVVLADGVHLPEGQVVTVLAPTPMEDNEDQNSMQPRSSLARQTAGMIPWSGDVEMLERLAMDPEFGLAESP